MKWLEGLGNAIEYIEDNLDKDISIDTAARIACCSACYFQRMFACAAGISLSEYIRRRRMSQAAFDLQGTNQKVLDIALKYGYASPTAFNRAFQKVHGIAPAAARNAGSVLNAWLPIQFSVKVTGEAAMSYHIARKAGIRIAGVRIPLVSDMGENQKRVPEFWGNTLKDGRFSDIAGLSDREPYGILGITVYQNQQDPCYYIAASTSKEIPDNMYEYKIPASTWVVFENDGPFKEDVQNIFKRFYTEWLPFSGYEYAGLPDIEVYPAMSEAPVNGHWEVWFAVKKRSAGNHNIPGSRTSAG